MDCEEVRELLDAYALGAVEGPEAHGLEEHVADCVRCWEELTEAQRAAAMLALSVAIEQAPPALREKLLERARAEERRRGLLEGLRDLLRRTWPAAAAVAAVAGAVALVFALALQAEVSDVRSENDRLESQVVRADRALSEHEQMLAVLAAPDVRQVILPASTGDAEASGVYHWSPGMGKGFIVCNKLPGLGEGQVYQAWFFFDGEAVSAGIFTAHDGTGQVAVDLRRLDRLPDAVGVSVEPAGGSDQPTGDMFLYATIER